MFGVYEFSFMTVTNQVLNVENAAKDEDAKKDEDNWKCDRER